MSLLEHVPLPVAMLVYIYYIPAAGISRNSQLSNSYEVREYRPFHYSKNQTFSPPLSSNEAGQDTGTLRHFSLQPLWTQLANLKPDSGIPIGHGEIARG